ncbi:MAG: diguanylate cyclase [Gammaproteobacteria bacterium]|nr:MAG: diguanylate cyclase [Gammaproteobacteria bacterium]
MSNSNIAILVVDDTRLSSAVVNRTLRKSPYTDIRYATNGNEALRLIEERPTDILIADWVMPEMDGLDLTDQIRQLDQARNHATYIMLLTAKEGPQAVKLAFDRGVDDFIGKTELQKQLLPRVYAADRISTSQNHLLKENKRLTETNQQLYSASTVDAVTGLGNDLYALKQLTNTLEHCQARGGACCYLAIELHPLEEIQRQYPQEIIDQILHGITRRLQQLIRPLDTLARISENELALISFHEHFESCTAKTFRRVYEGINRKAYNTGMGFISIQAAMSLSCVDSQWGDMPSAEMLMDLALEGLIDSKEQQLITVQQWQPRQQNFN